MSVADQTIRQLRANILYSLDYDLLSTAEFTCERLIAQNPNNLDSIHLYALVLYRRKRYKTAYNLTASYSVQHVGCSYLFAKSCLELKCESDGISALTRTLPLWSQLTRADDTDSRYMPDNVACYILLGKLYASVGDVRRSALNYSQVLKINPYMFEAFEELCKMGVKVKVNSIYKVNTIDEISGSIFKSVQPISADDKKGGFGFSDQKSDNKSFFKTPAHSSTGSANGGSIAQTPEQQNHTIMATPRVKQLQMPDAPNRKAAKSSNFEVFKHPSAPTDSIRRKSSRSSTSITSRLLGHPLNTLTDSNFTATSGVTGASSTASQNSKREGAGIKRVIGSTFSNTGVVGNEPKSDSIQRSNDQQLLGTYAKLAKGFKAMCFYDCFKAIRIFDSLPENERNTPWVLGKLGRLHFEIVNYEEAENYFIKLRQLDRTRIEEMEYYSTLLWHLHKEMDLSFLSHELHEISKDSPEAWIAVGNLFSLNREPDEAIKCFQKANQVDKNFAYSYTLQGHEYLSNDAFENALECFRHAILLDKRHYNAFYGIGMVYLKLGDFRKAEFHFRKAVEINPVNVILICCVGMVLEKLGKKEQALRQYIFASRLQPLSMLALFKKAQALISMKRYDMALKDFEKLENLAPDEASVHFLLGKLYRIYGRKNDAIKQFTIALNLDPKGSHLIKEALESLEDEEDVDTTGHDS
ncbi:hypothetical protein KL932_001570 [Ogataea haglerorum]|nr:hypothetical protein KL915_003348 [Ogataea haglerorum]KAG7743505.1 hypothetical protein KL932_001570 [Ogataea haglerorum]KAG7758474.1 hypothetical protein KL947_002853 [Ogataea haglerorum]KAG7809155.1 hypothetical protein KL924_003209 [Ogataea haglerorum]